MFERIRPYLPTAIFAFLIFYFSYQAMTGARGLLAMTERTETLAARTAELKTLTAERRELETRARLLRNDHLSRDLLEERAMAVLGYTDPRDYVIRIAQPAAPQTAH